MADSFAGTTINVLVTPAPTTDSPVAHHIHKYPGGNTYTIDVGGNMPDTKTLGLYFASFADYSTFKALRGTSGTLSLTLEGSMTALLVGVKQTAAYPSGYIEAEATFLV